MAAPVYRYTIHDLKTNVQLCDIPLTGVSYSKRLNDSGQASGTFTVTNRFATTRLVRDPYDATMPGRRCLYVWRDDIPQWGGIIWTRRYNSRSRQVQIGCGDWWSYYDHRKVLPVLTLPVNPAFDVAKMSLAMGSIDQNLLARMLIYWAGLHAGGDIGVVVDSSLSIWNADYTYRGYEMRDVGAALRELTNTLHGQDMIFDVGRALDAQGRPTRIFRQGAPHLGQQGSPWVWEYGGNLVEYDWPSDATRMATRTFAAGEGSVEGTPIAVSEDTTSYGSWPLLEAEHAYTTVSDASILQSHADADQQAQQRPVVLAKLLVRGNMAPRVGEWSMGDDARVTITDDFHTNGLDTAMRIVAAEVRPPDQGQDEAVTLTMAPLLDDVA